MHAPNYGQTTVENVIHDHPEAADVLRNYHVDVTVSRMLPVAQIAPTVSASTDEMLAVMEYRLRRAARKSK